MGICISNFKISNSNLNKVFNIIRIHKKHICETPSTKYISTKQNQLNQSNSDTSHIFSCYPTSKGPRETQNEAKLKMKEPKKKKNPS